MKEKKNFSFTKFIVFVRKIGQKEEESLNNAIFTLSINKQKKQLLS